MRGVKVSIISIVVEWMCERFGEAVLYGANPERNQQMVSLGSKSPLKLETRPF